MIRVCWVPLLYYGSLCNQTSPSRVQPHTETNGPVHYGQVTVVKIVQCLGDLMCPSVAQLPARVIAQDLMLGVRVGVSASYGLAGWGCWRRGGRHKCLFRPTALPLTYRPITLPKTNQTTHTFDPLVPPWQACRVTQTRTTSTRIDHTRP